MVLWRQRQPHETLRLWGTAVNGHFLLEHETWLLCWLDLDLQDEGDGTGETRCRDLISSPNLSMAK